MERQPTPVGRRDQQTENVRCRPMPLTSSAAIKLVRILGRKETPQWLTSAS